MIYEEPKVLVGTLTYEGHYYCQELALHNIKTMPYKNFKQIVVDTSKKPTNARKLRKLGYEVYRIKWNDSAMKRIIDGWNLMIKKAIDGGYDYLLCTAADWILPQHTITSLVSHDADIVGPLCKIKGRYGPPCVAKSGWQEDYSQFCKLDLYEWEEIMDLKPRLIKCHGAPIGMISRRVFEKIPFRYCEGIGEDLVYWQECKDNKFQFYCDLGVHVKHFQNPWRQQIWKKKKSEKKQCKGQRSSKKYTGR